MLKEFKAFMRHGNVLDLAIGIVIGAAFGKIVTSLVNDIVMPPIGLLLGKVNFSNLFINLAKTHYATLEDAKKAGAPTINYGMFINNILDFFIVAFVIFLVIRQVNRMSPLPPPSTKECEYCCAMIPMNATRCQHCTSQLTPG